MNTSEFSQKNSKNGDEFDLDAYLEEKSREGQTDKNPESEKTTSGWSDTAKNSMLVVLTLVLSVLWYHDWNLGKLNDRFFGASETAEFVVPPVPSTEPVIINIPEPDINIVKLAELREKARVEEAKIMGEAINNQLMARQETINRIAQQRIQEKLAKINMIGDMQLQLGNTSELVQKAMELQDALRLEELERLKVNQRDLRSTDQSQ